MNNKADEYRRNAVDCLRMAERTADLAARATLLDMAQAWRVLAEQADRNSTTDVVYETPAKSPSQQKSPSQHKLPPQQAVAQQQQQIQPVQAPDEKPRPLE